MKRGEEEEERERERETNATVECLFGTYRAVTECKGWKEGSAVMPSEKIDDGRYRKRASSRKDGRSERET